MEPFPLFQLLNQYVYTDCHDFQHPDLNFQGRVIGSPDQMKQLNQSKTNPKICFWNIFAICILSVLNKVVILMEKSLMMISHFSVDSSCKKKSTEENWTQQREHQSLFAMIFEMQKKLQWYWKCKQNNGDHYGARVSKLVVSNRVFKEFLRPKIGILSFCDKFLE